jgi:carbonic anhydrase/acetyltransferase-like protein (isoleucine patch superfamily)
VTPTIIPFGGKTPTIADDAFIAPTAAVIGDVEIGPGSSVWYGCTVRGDVNYIRIGAGSNLQDNSVIHVDHKTFPTIIGDHVLIGHMCVIHACTIEDGAMIGMRACVMDGAVVEAGAMVGAGALVTPGKRVPGGQLWTGAPAGYARDLTEAERENLHRAPRYYADYAQSHRQAVAALKG